MSTGSSGLGGDALLVGGRYRLGDKIGEGGMGAVYRATDAKTGRAVALKLLLDVEEKSLARFRREARAAAELRNPHIVALLDFDIDDPNGAYLVMELVEGASLSAILQAEPRLDPRRAVAIARQLFAALAHAHGSGIVHRDVKPGNILVARTEAAADFVRLVDFGLAKHTTLSAREAAITTVPTMLGTPAFMPPEQMMGEALDPRADVYAAGLVLYRMLAGEDAYTVAGPDRTQAIMRRQRGRPLASLAPWLSPALTSLVDACIAPEKSERPAAAADVLERLGQLEAVAAGSSLSPPPAFAPSYSAPPAMAQSVLASSPPAHVASLQPPIATTPSSASRSVMPFLIALLAVVALGALGLLAFVFFAKFPTTPPRVTVDASVDAAPVANAGVVVPPPSASLAAAPPSASSDVAPTVRVTPPSQKAASCFCVSEFGERMCQSVQGPTCSCGGTNAICPSPWTEQKKCEPGLFSYGGAGKKQGQPCNGFQFTTRQGKFVPEGTAVSSTLDCTSCSKPDKYAGVKGAACRGLRPTGELVSGTLFCP